MTVIVDSSFVYALYNAREQHHQAAVDYFRRSSDSYLVPDVALPEVCFLCRRDLGIFQPRHCDYFELLP